MEIKIEINDITLDSMIGKAVEYDEDGDTNVVGQVRMADLVAEKVYQGLVADSRYKGLKDRVTEIRDEEIRKRVAPLIEQALTRPFRKTTRYGEPTGPEITLNELIVETAQEQFRAPRNNDSYNRSTMPWVDEVVRDLVRAQFKGILEAEVKEAREKLVAAIRGEIGGDFDGLIRRALTKA
jgi:hypothetical protein